MLKVKVGDGIPYRRSSITLLTLSPHAREGYSIRMSVTNLSRDLHHLHERKLEILLALNFLTWKTMASSRKHNQTSLMDFVLWAPPTNL